MKMFGSTKVFSWKTYSFTPYQLTVGYGGVVPI